MILNGLWRELVILSLVKGSKRLSTLKDTAKWMCWLPLCWLVERRRGNTSAQGLLNWIPYAGWCRVREGKGAWIVALSGKEKRELSTFSKCPVSVTHLWSKQVVGYPGFWVNHSPKGLPHPPQHQGFLMGCWSWMLAQLLKHWSCYDQYRIKIVPK
jgi:hypothetical protein